MNQRPAHRRQHPQAAGVAAERLTVFVAHEEQIRPPVATAPMRYLPGGIFCCRFEPFGDGEAFAGMVRLPIRFEK